jgi:hypothetical protein
MPFIGHAALCAQGRKGSPILCSWSLPAARESSRKHTPIPSEYHVDNVASAVAVVYIFKMSEAY